VVGDIAGDLLGRFRWVEGHADIWRLFHDQPFFSRLAAALADPFRRDEIGKVAGIEARGFILGAAVALELRSGFVAVRKQAGLFPGEKLVRVTPPDYRQAETRLRVQRQSLSSGDRVLLVDDWLETGSQASTAKALIEEAGAELVGVSVIVDQLPPEERARFPRLSALLPYEALPTD
jgi:adenine phosphoribosyltransferase